MLARVYSRDSARMCFFILLVINLVLSASLSSHAATINEFPVPTDDSDPNGMAAGPDGNLWFTEASGNRIGEVVLAAQPVATSVPAMTEWGQVVFTMFAGIGSLYFLRRLKKSLARQVLFNIKAGEQEGEEIMFVQELGSNLAAEQTDLKVSIAKYQSLLFLALFLLTIFAAFLHNHADLKTHDDCALCKFSQDLSGGNKATPLVLPVPDFLAEKTYCVFESLGHFNGFFASSYSLRSPPPEPS
jgi:hypothetical protein